MDSEKGALSELAEAVLKADSVAIAEALTRMEDARPVAAAFRRALVAFLEARTPQAHTVVGLTGAPGAGKSTLASALIRHFLAEGSAVGMLAVDPSSRRSGGALLGDRARIHVEAGDRVFVRSMASRGELGGLAPQARASALVLRAAFDWTLVETVGVGQSEVSVESVSDSVVLVLQPGSGDALQFMKAGILEIPDVFVVHKWDLGLVAQQTRADLESMQALRVAPGSGWSSPVIGVSSRTGEGVAALAQALRQHRAHLDASGELERRRARGRMAWALEVFVQRYGTLGLERIGGRATAERLVRESSGSALDAASDLATRAGLEPAKGPGRA